MEHRFLGRSGFKVPVLSLGTGTFGGGNDFFKAWGDTDVQGAPRLVDICLEHGLTMFDSADIYSRSRGGARRSSSRPRRPSASATTRMTSAPRATT